MTCQSCAYLRSKGVPLLTVWRHHLSMKWESFKGRWS